MSHHDPAAAAAGNLSGLKVSIDIMDDHYKYCRAATVPSLAAAAHPQAQQGPPGAPPLGKRSLSYRDAAKLDLSTSPLNPSDDRRAEMLRRRSKVFGELKKANRADDRAFRLLQPANRPPVALGVVGKSFLEGIRWGSQTASPIEDIRKDSRGNYYVQICKAQFRLVEKRVQERRNDEQSIDLPSLGPTLVKDPRRCEKAGMTPAAVTRVHQDWTTEQIADEIWTSNKDRWQLGNNASLQDHLVVERRLTRRDPISEDPSDRIPSQTIKIWLSKDLAEKIEGDGSALRFDYQVKEVRRFEDSPPGRLSAARAQ